MPVLGLLLALTGLGCPSGEFSGEVGDRDAPAGAAGTDSASKPPVILVSIDTLRADRLPAYGYSAVDTPAIDRLRADGVLFERAYSHYPLTFPAHASLLTGLLPPEHGIRDNMGYSLADDLPFLPQWLQQAGYATGGFVSSFTVRGNDGLSRGFDVYDDQLPMSQPATLGEGEGEGEAPVTSAAAQAAQIGQKSLQRPGAETVARALDWLDGVKDQPFFLFLHLFEPHTPYEAPEPYASRYPSAYDAEVAFADSIFQQLLDGLDPGIYQQAIIVLTSDHGEGLGEHGEDEHGIFLYRSTLQVPMIVKLPAAQRAGEVVDVPAQLVDIFPTVASLVEGRPPTGLAGDSLLGLTANSQPRALYAETYYPRFYFGWSELRSLVRGQHQYIESPSPELFDLIADPAQGDNLIPAERNLYRSLRDQMATIDPKLASPAEVDAETRQQLQSLGYVGGGRAVGKGELPAPATQSHLLALLKDAHVATVAGDGTAALAIYRQIVEENPAMTLAWKQRARLAVRLGQLDEASMAFRSALELAGGEPPLALEAARLELRRGQLPEAEALASSAVSYDASTAKTLLARIAMAGGDSASARRHASEATMADAAKVEPRLLLASLDAAAGNFEAGLAQLDEASALASSPVRELQFMRGDLLARQGRGSEAAEAFEEELRQFPDNLRAHGSLAMLLASSGQSQRAQEVLRRMIEQQPRPEAYALAVRFLRTLGDQAAAQRWLTEGQQRFPGNAELQRLAAGD